MPGHESLPIDSLQDIANEQKANPAETVEIAQEELRKRQQNTELLTDVVAVANSTAKKGKDMVLQVFKFMFSKK